MLWRAHRCQHSRRARLTSRAVVNDYSEMTFKGKFLCHALHAGGLWNGDIVVADIEELEKCASEVHFDVIVAKTC